jgi:hypothetical protein
MKRRGSRSRLAITLLAVLLLGTSPALADDYDSKNAAHPLRIVGYVLHPVGVILETLLVRPAHWLVSTGPMRTLFGHKERFSDHFNDDSIADSIDPGEG